MALNHQLLDRGARLVWSGRTSPRYRLYALPGTHPEKPGLVRTEPGAAIWVEVWRLSTEAFGSFVSEVPPPLGIGNLELQTGDWVKGFICEGYALRGAPDITDYGGFRSYLAQKTSPR